MFLPFARLTLDSPRSPDELVAVLQRLTRPHPPLEFRVIRPRETATFVGDVSKERLEFRRAFRGRNSFAPYVVGRIIQGPGGARIEAIMRPQIIVLVFVAVWLIWLAPWALIGASELVKQGAGSEPWAWIPVVMWAAMYPMCMLGFIPDAMKMRRMLREIANGGPGFE